MTSDELPPGVVSAADVALPGDKKKRPALTPLPASRERAPGAVGEGMGVRAALSQITALEPQQKHQDRVNVFVDGKFALGLFEEVVVALGLHVGQRITPERLEEIARAETVRRAREAAYRLLSFRARSEKEIEDRLRRRGYEDEVIAEVVVTLRTVGYVDDAQFAQTWVQARGKSRGRRALAHELRQKGVAGDLAARTLDEAKSDEAEFAAARTVAVKRVGERPEDTSREAQAKLAAFLQRRGFGWDVVRPVLADLYAERAAADAEAEDETGASEAGGLPEDFGG